MEQLWEYISGLPPMLSFTLIVLAIAAIVIIAVKGHFKAKMGNKEVDLGESSDEDDSDERGAKPESSKEFSIRSHNSPNKTPISIPKPPPTVTIVQRRSCGDCILIMMGEREKYEINMRHETDHILRTQMSYAEQKLVEIQTILVNSYSNKLFDCKVKVEGSESVQHKLFYGLIRDALLLAKNEIRRSFKDNGFYELHDTDFNVFVKDKMRVLMSMLQQHLRNIYPDSGTALNIQDVIHIIEDNYSKIESIVFDAFAYSKEVKADTEKRIVQYKEAFANWINKFTLK